MYLVFGYACTAALRVRVQNHCFTAMHRNAMHFYRCAAVPKILNGTPTSVNTRVVALVKAQGAAEPCVPVQHNFSKGSGNSFEHFSSVGQPIDMNGLPCMWGVQNRALIVSTEPYLHLPVTAGCLNMTLQFIRHQSCIF